MLWRLMHTGGTTRSQPAQGLVVTVSPSVDAVWAAAHPLGANTSLCSTLCPRSLFSLGCNELAGRSRAGRSWCNGYACGHGGFPGSRGSSWLVAPLLPVLLAGVKILTQNFSLSCSAACLLSDLLISASPRVGSEPDQALMGGED